MTLALALGTPDPLSYRSEMLVSPVERSVVRMIDVPDAYVGGTYMSIFTDLLLNHDCLPLGLYCCVSKQVGSGLDNTLPFVLTNPKQTTKLLKGDKVYVLAGTSELLQGQVCKKS